MSTVPAYLAAIPEPTRAAIQARAAEIVAQAAPLSAATRGALRVLLRRPVLGTQRERAA